ncbi:hypothetical protein TNCV_3498021 [Trichonephila clavipes]|nr:hypothetical protein TNCV_3498021 [Trichonephila clavipes]
MLKDKSWAILIENPSWAPGAPRKAVVAHFRLLTGFNLHFISLSFFPFCSPQICGTVAKCSWQVLLSHAISSNPDATEYECLLTAHSYDNMRERERERERAIGDEPNNFKTWCKSSKSIYGRKRHLLKKTVVLPHPHSGGRYRSMYGCEGD